MKKFISSQPMLSPGLLRSDAGFTLVEVMIAAAIAIVVILGIAEVLVSSARQDFTTKIKHDQYSDRQQRRYENKIAPAPTPD